MRTVNIIEIIECERFCQESNYNLNDDIKNGFELFRRNVENGKEIWSKLLKMLRLPVKNGCIFVRTPVWRWFFGNWAAGHITGEALPCNNEG